MNNNFYKHLSSQLNKVTFENERALSYTTLLKKKDKKVLKKFIAIDKKLDITFSLEMPLEIREGNIHMFPVEKFTVLGHNISEQDTMKKYYESIGESWEQFKAEFFNEYSNTVNPILFQMEDK